MGEFNKEKMNLTAQIAKRVREFYFGGNWTESTLKDNLAGVTWQLATTQVNSLNTIAALIIHMNYFVDAVLKVMKSEPLEASNKYIFNANPMLSPEDWEKLLDKTWADAEAFADQVEQMPESKLWEHFSQGKDGNFYHHITGVIEHNHYHLGQIVLIKKMLLHAGKAPHTTFP
jgi:hypothetical protein